MHELGDLLILRLKNISQMTAKISEITLIQQSDILEQQILANKEIIKIISQTKKTQKIYKTKQFQLIDLFKQLKFHSSKVVQEVNQLIGNIMQTFDPNFNNQNCQDASITEKLKQTLRNIIKFDKTSQLTNKIQIAIKNHITDSSPYIILRWLCNWITNYITKTLQESWSIEQARHQQKIRQINLNRCQSFINKQKQQCTSIIRYQPSLTNKQSIFGLLLDQMSFNYKQLGIQDLDMNYLKIIKKINNGKQEISKQQFLIKAAQILIQTKNKGIKQKIDDYYRYYNKSKILNKKSKRPQTIFINYIQRYKQQQTKQYSASPIKKLQRIKSQKQQDEIIQHKKIRKSLLLTPKTKQISFQTSNQIQQKIKRNKTKRQLILPNICDNHTIKRQKSTAKVQTINRSLRSMFQRAMQKCDNRQNLDNHFVMREHFQFKNYKNNNISFAQRSKSPSQQRKNPQVYGRRINESDLRLNRKLLLQLLRQKNRNTDFQK